MASQLKLEVPAEGQKITIVKKPPWAKLAAEGQRR